MKIEVSCMIKFYIVRQSDAVRLYGERSYTLEVDDFAPLNAFAKSAREYGRDLAAEAWEVDRDRVNIMSFVIDGIVVKTPADSAAG